jgi:CHAT domain-containing protein/Tfp pilus assembly protein PilF
MKITIRDILLFTFLLFFINSICPANNKHSLYKKEYKKDSLNQKDSIELYRQIERKYTSEGEYINALNSFKKILSLKKNKYSKYHPEIAKAYANIGVVYKKKGQLEKSLEYYNKAIVIFKSNKTTTNITALGSLYSNLGNIFSLQKNFNKAESYYKQSIKLLAIDSLMNLRRISMAYNNLGLLYKDSDAFKKSIHYYKKSYQLKKRLNLPLNSILINLANVYKEMGELKTADKYYSKAKEEIVEAYGKTSNYLGSNYLNHGVLKLQSNNYVKAEQYFHKALEIFIKTLGKRHPKTSNCYINLGDLYFNQKNYKKAVQNYQNALISTSDSFNNKELNENPRINEIFSKNAFLKILKRKASSLKEMARNEEKNLILALKTYDRALEVIREIRLGYMNEETKLKLTAKERETFVQAIKLSTKLYKITNNKKYLHKAFNYSERSKAAVLYENIQSNQALQISTIPDSLQSKENGIKKKIWTLEEMIYEEKQKKNPNNKQLKYWQDQLFKLNNAHEDLVLHLEKNYPNYYQLKYNLKVPTKSFIQKKLVKNEVIVEYVLTDNVLFSFIIKKDDFAVRKTPIDSSFLNSINALQKFLAKRNFSDHSKEDFDHFNEISYKLYSKLIEPLDIKKGERLIIVPDNILSYIPFEILIKRTTKLNKIRYKELAYLIKDHPLSYSYSTKVLFNQKNQQNKPMNQLGAYAPSYTNIEALPDNINATRQKYREKLYPLKGILKEVNRISKIVPGKVFTNNEATEEKFKESAGKFDILHLAMHTIINDEDPMYSKMAFAQESNSNEDNFLNTYEIYNLNLKSKLTVLSSCNTGFGKLSKGEGVMSLARGFKYAGCPSIVMTLWPVEDNSSIRLMEYFYRALKEGRSKDKALQIAKIKFLENSDRLHAHPYFWSGYLSIGDQSPLYFKSSFYWIGGLLLFLVIAGIIFYQKRKKLFQLFNKF